MGLDYKCFSGIKIRLGMQCKNIVILMGFLGVDVEVRGEEGNGLWWGFLL